VRLEPQDERVTVEPLDQWAEQEVWDFQELKDHEEPWDDVEHQDHEE